MAATSAWIKKNKQALITWGVIILIAFGVYSYYHWYIPYRDLKAGFVIVNNFNCPNDYPIKAHLGSMIYHNPGDPYYTRTSASNGYCFDTPQHAEQQGFRASYGTPPILTALTTSNAPYQGGYAPDGTFCIFGYNTRTKNCCDDDDYSCEVQDRAPKGATALCVDGTYSVSQSPTYDCSAHGGVETNAQYTPFVQ